jgi:hypothetical protein
VGWREKTRCESEKARQEAAKTVNDGKKRTGRVEWAYI